MKYDKEIIWKYLFYFTVLIGITQFIIFGLHFLYFFILCFLICTILFFKWLSQNAPKSRKDLYSAVMVILPALFTTSAYAYDLGNNFYPLTEKNITYLKIDEFKKPVIKIYDQWTLVEWNNKEFAWVHNSKNQVIFLPNNYSKFKGILCENFPQYCIKFYPNDEINKK